MEASIRYQITKSKFMKTFASSSRSTVSLLSTDRKKTIMISTTTCSTKMMKSRILIKICFSMTMIKRYKCSRNWRIKKPLSCKSRMSKKVPHL